MYVLVKVSGVHCSWTYVSSGPGSFLEVRKMLPLLTEASPDHPSFHVVAPSLPNFGFSEAVKERGFHGDHYDEAVNKLMLALGYKEYGAPTVFSFSYTLCLVSY